MSNPRYRPRAYAQIPVEFGKYEEISWLAPANVAEQDRLWAARWHHLYACRINKRLRESGQTVAQYAEMTGSRYDRLSKMLRGDVLIKFEDVAQAERLLGRILRATPRLTSNDDDF
ncbi:hypothetical protein GY21_08780 [Cryobacterium roopkundense]|uniref:HTH cro/C1-type domain-containing protein n=1 Tax=Cryobacterium roopkundense TaxID=1001240 RepID=A0A099JH80_9MICO|nr:hypothetical protein [Cryobacterium roopkundense]KGJ76927.1 hypothetical protein GY21_08780 [Cryobacterium roopkundense]MBB5643167.1 hypothetical protein [Cryobacterium roopkundense]